MASWRRRALEQFPELRPSLNDPEYTIYRLFFDLLPMAVEAHRAGDDLRLAPIYEYDEWCAREPSEQLWNPAGVAFYEHLFDQPSLRSAVPRWLSSDIRTNHMGLWEARLAPKDFSEVKKLLAATPPRQV